MKKVLFWMAVFSLFASCSGGGVSAPTPTQIPQTIEYMGDKADDGLIGMELTGSINFAVKNADGITIDPELVIPTITDTDGEELSDPGTIVATDDDLWEYTAPSEFVNAESKVLISFSLADTSVSLEIKADGLEGDTENIVGLAVARDQIGSGEYSFAEPEIISDTSTGDYISSGNMADIAITEKGVIYACYTRMNYESSWETDEGDTYHPFVNKQIVIIKSSDFGESWSDPNVITTWSTHDDHITCSVAAFGEERVAIGWPDDTPSDGSDEYYNVALSSDSSETFGDPIIVNNGVDTSPDLYSSPQRMNIAYDSDGRLHAVFQAISTTDGPRVTYDIYYTYYDEDETSGAFASPVRINTEASSVYKTDMSVMMSLATYGSNPTYIVTEWQDIRSAVFDEATPLGMTLNMGLISNDDGDIEIARDEVVAGTGDPDSPDFPLSADITVDQNNDIFMTYTYGIGVGTEDLRVNVFMSKWSEADESFSDAVSLSASEEDDIYAFYPAASVNYANYISVAYDYVTKVDDSWDIENGGIRMLLGAFIDNDGSADEFESATPIDTSEGIDALPASSYLSIANHKSGRMFLVAFVTEDDRHARWDNLIYFSKGTLNSELE